MKQIITTIALNATLALGASSALALDNQDGQTATSISGILKQTEQVQDLASNPTFATFNKKYYKDGKIIEKYLGDVVAVKGQVIAEKPGPSGKPIFEIQLDDIANKTLWVGSLVKMLEGSLKPGDRVDVLGFFDETKNEQQYMAKLTEDTEYLIGFCFNVHKNGLPIYFTQWLGRCMDW